MAALLRQKTIKLMSLNIKYLVVALYLIEYKLKRICKTLHSVFTYVFHSVTTFLNQGCTTYNLILNYFGLLYQKLHNVPKNEKYLQQIKACVIGKCLWLHLVAVSRMDVAGLSRSQKHTTTVGIRDLSAYILSYLLTTAAIPVYHYSEV